MENKEYIINNLKSNILMLDELIKLVPIELKCHLLMSKMSHLMNLKEVELDSEF